jgi:DNA end-binding protein Ku
MAARSSWKGFLKLSLVSVPVKAYTATASGEGKIQLNQLHAECHSRIQYKKVCPIHGEVKSDEIVSGYKHANDQYVVIDTSELDKLRTEDDKAISIKTFVPPETIDPIYQSDSTYYLVPDGPVGQKPYGLLLEAMVQENRHGIAQIVLHGKEQIVLLRPIDNLLAMTVLKYENQITKPSTFKEEVTKPEIAPEELKLAKTLIEASTAKKFDFSQYKDLYTEKLTQLIEAKVAGEELVAPPVHDHPQIINLMDALKKSLEKLEKPGKEVSKARPPKKMAPSKPARASETRKKKSS